MLTHGHRQGRAWLSQTIDLDGHASHFIGYWETDDAEPSVLEQAPPLVDSEAALMWARERAPVVLIRMADSDYFSAGECVPAWEPTMKWWTESEAPPT
jgi:hypothetical protein